MPESPERTALYRLYDVDDQLLYVGISHEPEERLKDHKWDPHHGRWTDQVVRQEIEWCASLSAARGAEAQAIQAERPLHNGTHNHPLAPFSAEAWPKIPGRHGKVDALAALICEEIDAGRWRPGMKIPASKALALATGMSKSAATNAIRKLHAEGRLKVIRGVGVFVYDGIKIHRPNRHATP